TKDGQVVLARQFRPAQEKYLLELPGGGIDEEESPEQGAARELLEETGFAGELHFLGTMYESAYDTMVRYNFAATDCVKVQEPTHFENEQTEPVLLLLEEFKKHLQGCELTDVATGYIGLEFLERRAG
ncbi:MAG TPA: NUDIX hydrolase, partial [Patescibacteria group bacterium]|nr:NUDIX hydrolase [Patescibacteria group bacterium]